MTMNTQIPANMNAAPKGELDAYFESKIQETTPVKEQLKNSVSQIALLLPGIFLGKSNPADLVKALEVERNIDAQKQQAA